MQCAHQQHMLAPARRATTLQCKPSNSAVHKLINSAVQAHQPCSTSIQQPCMLLPWPWCAAQQPTNLLPWSNACQLACMARTSPHATSHIEDEQHAGMLHCCCCCCCCWEQGLTSENARQVPLAVVPNEPTHAIPPVPAGVMQMQRHLDACTAIQHP
jgi:hypothetical protein